MVQVSNIVAGRYEIGERIRQDAVSALCAARDTKNNRKVWLKVASPGPAADKQFGERFQQEAKDLAELKSAQISQVLDSGVDGDVYYIVFEPAAGKTLAAILREEGSLEVEPAMKIAEQVALCLHALAQKGLVHRAINPANILITPAEDVVVIDFGLMRGANTSGMSFTEVSATPDYISPELVEGGQAIDVRSDIYTLGVTIYTMLAGEVPFRGNSPMDIIMKHLSAPVPSLRAVRPDTPPEVDAIVKRCLAKAPRDRYPTPAELINAIRSAMGLAPVELAAAAPPPPPPAKVEAQPRQKAVPPPPSPAAKVKAAPPQKTAPPPPPPAAAKVEAAPQPPPPPPPAAEAAPPEKAARPRPAPKAKAKAKAKAAPPPAAEVEAAPPEAVASQPQVRTVDFEQPEKAAPPPPPPAAKAKAAPPEKAAPPAEKQPSAPSVPYLRCPHCGQKIPATEKLCPHCGRPVAAATPPPSGTAPLTSPRLVVRVGPERGMTYILQAEARVGRGAGNDVALSDPRASRRHSQITRQGSQYILVDLGSSNGTLVNKKRIQGGYALKEGDVITLGGTELVFHF